MQCRQISSDALRMQYVREERRVIPKHTDGDGECCEFWSINPACEVNEWLNNPREMERAINLLIH